MIVQRIHGYGWMFDNLTTCTHHCRIASGPGKSNTQTPADLFECSIVQSHPWFVQHLQPDAFEGNDARFARNIRSKQNHESEAQSWQVPFCWSGSVDLGA